VANERIDRLLDTLRGSQFDALALIPGPNLTYLTGLSFHLMERPVMVLLAPDHKPVFILPELEKAKAESSGLEADIFPYGEDQASWTQAFAGGAHAFGLDGMTVAVEPLRIRWMELQRLREAAPGATIESGGPLLERLRAIKTHEEITNMRQAVWVAEQALDETIKNIQLGMTERDLASELTLQLLRAGSDPELPFAQIVATGPNCAVPHATPTSRQLRAGELLLLDWGANVQGYVSDLTRTLAIGAVDPELVKIHQVVQEANQAARQAVQPGRTCGEIDAAARGVIEAAGYGDFFVHRTGHGLGLEAHEPPFIRQDNPKPLEPGMAFTIEPGIYLEGKGGVRIEDDMVVTDDAGESLSTTRRELVTLA
jgi:Xaa-Pro dipeptidase